MGGERPQWPENVPDGWRTSWIVGELCSVLRGSALSREGRHCHERVGTVTRGSALSREGRHCHERVGTVTRGSALSPEGRHCHQRVGTVTRGSALSPEGQHLSSCTSSGVPGIVVGVGTSSWASACRRRRRHVCVGVSASSREPWRRLHSRGIVRRGVASVQMSGGPSEIV